MDEGEGIGWSPLSSLRRPQVTIVRRSGERREPHFLEQARSGEPAIDEAGHVARHQLGRQQRRQPSGLVLLR